MASLLTTIMKPLILSFIALLPILGYSQNTIVIPDTMVFAQNNMIGTTEVQPGDTLVFKSGSRREFLLKNFKGTESNPIVLTHEVGDSAVFDISENTYSLSIGGCSHIHLLGKRRPDQEYFGIQLINDSVGGHLGLTKGTLFTEVEAIYTHGPLPKTYPDVGNSYKSGPAVLVKESLPNDNNPNGYNGELIAAGSYLVQSIHIHDCFFENSGTEAIYIGETSNNSVEIDTPAYDSLVLNFDPVLGALTSIDTIPIQVTGGILTLLPHYLDDVIIENNYILNSGWDGIQVSRSSNVVIRNNRVEGFGMNVPQTFYTNDIVQVHGIVFGAGNSGSVYNNFVERGVGHGIMAKPSGNSSLFNNIIVNQGGDIISTPVSELKNNSDAGIRAYLVDMDVSYNRGANIAGVEKRLGVVHNLLINSKRDGIKVYTSTPNVTTPNTNGYFVFMNNVVLEIGGEFNVSFQFNGLDVEDLNPNYDEKFKDKFRLDEFNFFDPDRVNAQLSNVSTGEPYQWDFVPRFQTSPLLNKGELTNEALYPDYYGRLRLVYSFGGLILDYSIPPDLDQFRVPRAKVEYGPVERTIYDN